MARRIVCSEFDTHALRMAAAEVIVPRVIPPDQRKWNWATHRSILDCVPVRQIDKGEDDILTVRSTKGLRRHIKETHKTGKMLTSDMLPRETMGDGKCPDQHRNRKTIGARRKELVQMLRRERVSLEQHIIATMRQFDSEF